MRKFSLWCDYISRDFLLNGEFDELLKSGVITGVTTNPAIFKEALSSPAYAEQKASFAKKNAKKLYEILAASDVKLAAQKMLALYAKSLAEEQNAEGFVSFEISPALSFLNKASFAEAKKLFAAVKMPNVMVKIPATPQGLKAAEKLVASGISVNATLVFSHKQTSQCVKAFEKGTRRFLKKFPHCPPPECVVSVFVSRFDRALNAKCRQLGLPLNEFGVKNAIYCYNLIEKSTLKNVRTLFASTGAEGVNKLNAELGEPPLCKDYYINALLLPHTINTAPLSALKAFVQRKTHEFVTPPSEEELNKFFVKMQPAVEYDALCEQLLSEGLEAFERAFSEILKSVKR